MENNKMLAAVVRNFGVMPAIEEVLIPIPGPGQVVVKVMASGVCHTDLHAIDGDWPVKPKLPFIPGHEGAGLVARLGPGVTSLKEGDRVGLPWLHDACGHCDHCLSGWETLCARQRNTGYSVNGCFAEYVLADAAYLVKIPSSLSFLQAAPILCAGVTAYKGLREVAVRPGQWVVISGVGGLGHMAIQYARAMGMHVAGVDLSVEKLSLAMKLGAEVVVNASRQEPGEEIQRIIGGAHGVLVTAVSPAAFKQAMGMLRRGGTCALVGLPPGDFPVSIFDLVLKGLTIRGSIVGTREDLHEALQFAADGTVMPRLEIHKMSALSDVLERMRQGRLEGRVVLDLSTIAAEKTSEKKVAA